MKEVDTEDSLTYWLAKAKKGEKVMYFDGFLMYEKQKCVMAGIPAEGFSQKIKTAMLAWRAYLEGLVVLVQRKREEGDYEYIAIKC